MGYHHYKRKGILSLIADDIKISDETKNFINGVLKGRCKTHRNHKFFYASDPNQPNKSKIIPNPNEHTTTKEAV